MPILDRLRKSNPDDYAHAADKLNEVIQSGLQAHAERDIANRELTLRAQHEEVELDLKRAAFASEQAKLRADLDLKRATFDAEQAKQAAQLELERQRLEGQLAKQEEAARHNEEIRRLAAEGQLTGERAKSVVLFIVVLAVITTPILAMLANVSGQLRSVHSTNNRHYRDRAWLLVWPERNEAVGAFIV